MPSKYNRYTAINPGNVLKKALEFERLDKPLSSIEAISDFLNSRRLFQISFDSSLELLLKKYIDLAVRLRVSSKGVLNRYRAACYKSPTQQIHLRRIYEYLLGALKAYEEIEIDLLKKHYGKKKFIKIQLHAESLTFLWECYQEVLDNIKYIPSLIEIYRDTVQTAISFCSKLERSKELRKLHSSTSSHILSMAKKQSANGKDTVDLTDTTLLHVYIGVRFDFLNSFYDFGLVSCILKVIEEVDVLTQYPKSGINSFAPNFFINYFDTLSYIFWDTRRYLLHANVLYRLYNVLQMNEPMEKLEEEILKTQIILATLAIPYDEFFEMSPLEAVFDEKVAKMLNFFEKSEFGYLSRKDLLKKVRSDWGDLLKANEDLLLLVDAFDPEAEYLKSNPVEFAKKSSELVKKAESKHEFNQNYCEVLKKYCSFETLKLYSQFFVRIEIEVLEKALCQPFENFEFVARQHFRCDVDLRKGVIVFRSQKSLPEKLSELKRTIVSLAKQICPQVQDEEECNKKMLMKRKQQFYEIVAKDQKERSAEKITKNVLEKREKDLEKQERHENEAKNDATGTKDPKETKSKEEKEKITKKSAQKTKKAKVIDKAEKQKEEARKEENYQSLLAIKRVWEEEKVKHRFIPHWSETPLTRKLVKLLLDKKNVLVANYKAIMELRKEAEEERKKKRDDFFQRRRDDEDYLECAIRKSEQIEWESKSKVDEKGITDHIREYCAFLKNEKALASVYGDWFVRVKNDMQAKHKALVEDQNERKRLHDEKRAEYKEEFKRLEENKLAEAEEKRKESEKSALEAKAKKLKTINDLIRGSKEVPSVNAVAIGTKKETKTAPENSSDKIKMILNQANSGTSSDEKGAGILEKSKSSMQAKGFVGGKIEVVSKFGRSVIQLSDFD